MPSISLATAEDLTEAEVLALYESVGWAAYTNSPSTLRRALENSTCIVTARDSGGELVGLARALSDDASICYIQDILVRADSQGHGVGKLLMKAVFARFAEVRQIVLITDDDPAQRGFYEAIGLTEGADFESGPLRMFARLR